MSGERSSSSLADRVARNWRIMARHGEDATPWSRLPAHRWLPITIATVAAIGFAALFLDPRAAGWVAGQPSVSRAFFQAITDIGKSGWILYPTGLLLVVVALSDWRDVSARLRAAWAELAAFSMVVFLAVGGSGLLTNILKIVFGRARPPFVDDGVFVFTPFSFAGYPTASFPSGHSTTAGALAVILSCGPERWRVPALVAALIIAFSRVMVGVHYPSDVIAGFALGAGVAWAIIHAMALGRFGFRFDREGRTVWRLPIFNRLRQRPGWLSDLIPALWLAMRGSRH